MVKLDQRRRFVANRDDDAQFWIHRIRLRRMTYRLVPVGPGSVKHDTRFYRSFDVRALAHRKYPVKPAPRRARAVSDTARPCSLKYAIARSPYLTARIPSAR